MYVFVCLRVFVCVNMIDYSDDYYSVIIMG